MIYFSIAFVVAGMIGLSATIVVPALSVWVDEA